MPCACPRGSRRAMRSFVGLPVEGAAAAACLALQEPLPVGRPVPEENLHLTLAFLDDQSEVALEALHEALEVLRAPAMVLRATGLGLIGGRRPRLLALEVAPDPALSALRDAVRRAARGAGIDLPRERFRPHVTVQRFGAGLRPEEAPRLSDALQALPFAPFDVPVARLTLYRSTLTPEGPIYDPLADYPLQPA